MSRGIVHRVSRLFQPVSPVMKNLSKVDSQKGYNLMLDNGIIKQVNPGMYALLPLGLRSLQKLINLVENEMTSIGAQKLQLPVLTSTDLWKKTDRLSKAQDELFLVRDRRNKSYILSPTYEEMITKLISELQITKSALPLLLYQISNKWRDEMKPRLGLLRGREFVMKDLYTFDMSLEEAKKTYDLVCQAYDNIFKQIGIHYVKAIGDTGIMGGKISHEYHYFSDIGEDIVSVCPTCSYAINTNISESECPECKKPFTENNAIEVGHTFLLDTKYSDIFKAKCHSQNNKVPLVMGCYGLGLTRILASAIEILSSPTYLRWPANMAPYDVCIIGPKKGSKEENVSNYINDIYDTLTQSNVDTIVDDRSEMTIGKRMLLANQTGYPFVIVVGKLANETRPLFEFHDVYSSTSENLSIESISDYFSKKYHDLNVKKSMVC